jgi:hypothetical protein
VPQLATDDKLKRPAEAIETVCESLANTGAKVDRENSIIRGVKIIGISSKNGRDYPERVLRDAIDRYEGVRVNIDHPDKSPTQPRSVKDRVGTLSGVEYQESNSPGLYGDLKFNPKHSDAEQILWAIENDPSSIGLSHNASVRISGAAGSRKTVESIDGVRSVDIVADPATTSGIFESVDPEEPSEETEGILSDKANADRIIGAACDLLSDVRYSHGNKLTPTEQAAKAVEIARDLINELSSKKQKTESEEMDLSTLTIEQLRESRPDLVEAVEATQAETLSTVTEERDALLAEKQSAEHAALVESELRAAKLDPQNNRHVGNIFMRTLLATEDRDTRAELIADRCQLVLESDISDQHKPPQQHQKPVTTAAPARQASSAPVLTTESIASVFSRS